DHDRELDQAGRWHGNVFVIKERLASLEVLDGHRDLTLVGLDQRHQPRVERRGLPPCPGAGQGQGQAPGGGQGDRESVAQGKGTALEHLSSSSARKQVVRNCLRNRSSYNGFRRGPSRLWRGFGMGRLPSPGVAADRRPRPTIISRPKSYPPEWPGEST